MDINDLEEKLGIEGLSVDDQMELLDALQKSTQARLEIANQEAIGKSTQVVIQGLKKIKSDLEIRFSQLNATIESKASSLRDGKDGKDGKNGKDGLEGKQGVQGSNGQDGRDGRDGLDGTDGISVVDAKIDFDGSLIITLSDGNILNVGEVVSPDIAEKINVISTMSTNGAVAILDEGTSITSGVKKINFVGASVTATNSGDDVTVNVSAGTGTVTSVAANAGTGISITGSPITTTGTLNITNTAPDQTVALTGAGTTSITGTYPNFTITSNDSATGTVTSVAATVPSFLSVSGSPITTTGTLAITLSGTALPIANGGTGATTLAGASIATYSGTETLTNKRIDPRVTSAASASSLTPDISASDVYAYTALAAGLTINAPIGTPLDGDKLIFRLLDNGTSRSLTWNGTYTVIGVTLPTATTISKTTYVGCIYNANNTRWDVIAVTTQA